MVIDDPIVYPIDLLTDKPLSEDPEDIDEITLRVHSRTAEPLMFFDYDEWPCHSGVEGDDQPPWGTAAMIIPCPKVGASTPINPSNAKRSSSPRSWHLAPAKMDD